MLYVLMVNLIFWRLNTKNYNMMLIYTFAYPKTNKNEDKYNPIIWVTVFGIVINFVFKACGAQVTNKVVLAASTSAYIYHFYRSHSARPFIHCLPIAHEAQWRLYFYYLFSGYSNVNVMMNKLPWRMFYFIIIMDLFIVHYASA